jgi:hypothetical protein
MTKAKRCIATTFGPAAPVSRPTKQNCDRRGHQAAFAITERKSLKKDISHALFIQELGGRGAA